MRNLLVVFHRWFGLGIALFLAIAGLTGALMAWDHEIDAWLNPELYVQATPGEPLDPLLLAERVEAADPRIHVRYLPLHAEPGKAIMFSVEPRVDPSTGKPFELDFDQVAVDPSSGEVQGRRLWGKVSLSREHLMPFIYRLHYSLHLGDETGVWLMGIVAMVWLVDAFIALYISFPSRRSWRKSFAFRFDKGGYKLNFDLHRSGGVWVWLLLVPLAFSAVYLNLGRQVVRPLVALVSPLTPNPFSDRAAEPNPVAPVVTRGEALALARREAAQRGLAAPAGGMFHASDYNVYGVGFYNPGQDHGDGGLGNPWLYFDATTGAAAGADIPGEGSAGDLLLQLQFPLHSGRILGLAGRVIISFLGVVITMLSVTGIVIWARKRRVRVLAAEKLDGRSSDSLAPSSVAGAH